MSAEILLAAAAALGVGVGGFSSGAVGMGFPLMAIPAIALGYGLETAVIVAIFPTMAINILNLRGTFHERHEASGMLLFGTAAAGAAIAGTLLRGSVNERILVGVLTAVIVIYLVTEILPTIDLRSLAHKRSAATTAGAASGALESTVGVSGPLLGVFFLNRTETRHEFIFHVTVVFMAMGIVRVITFASIGAFTVDRLLAGCLIAAFATIFRTVGFAAGDRINREQFRKIVMAIVALSLVPLLIQTFYIDA